DELRCALHAIASRIVSGVSVATRDSAAAQLPMVVLSCAAGSRRIAVWTPDVTAYVWSDVADKVARFEPMILLSSAADSPQPRPPPPAAAAAVALGGSGLRQAFELARWRNLSILATATACSHLVISSADADTTRSHTTSTSDAAKSCSVQKRHLVVDRASAVQRLARYLKSAAVEQRRAVILALGARHVSSAAMLLDVLARYDADAFQATDARQRLAAQQLLPPIYHDGVVASAPPVKDARSKPVRTQHQSQSQSQSQLSLQWALARCYYLLLRGAAWRRSLVDATDGSESLLVGFTTLWGRVCTVAASTVDRIQDASAMMRVLAQLACPSASSSSSSYSAAMETSTEPEIDRNRSLFAIAVDNFVVSRVVPVFTVDTARQERWLHAALAWSASFAALATGARHEPRGWPHSSLGRQRSDACGSQRVCDVWADAVATPSKQQQHPLAARGNGWTVESSNAPLNSEDRRPSLADCSATSLTQTDVRVAALTGDTLLFRWLDECFAVSSATHPQVETLQSFAHGSTACAAAFRRHERGPRGCCVWTVCVEKALFSQRAGDKHHIAKQYLVAVHDVLVSQHEEEGEDDKDARSMELLRRLPTPLFVRVMHIALLHLGIDDDARQRARAVALIDVLSRSPSSTSCSADGRVSAATANGTRGRSSRSFQLTASAFLASRQPPARCFQMSVRAATLPRVLRAQRNSGKSLAMVLRGSRASSSIQPADELEREQLLTLFVSAHDVALADVRGRTRASVAHAHVRGYTDSAATEDAPPSSRNLPSVAQFLFLQRSSVVRLATARTVAWWLCRWQYAAHDVLRALLVLADERRRLTAERSASPSSAEPPLPIDDALITVVLPQRQQRTSRQHARVSL
ncbi:hypothetical protein PINS_up018213, partial [Pythium insidiosum]